jgi:hypothetical protein
VWSMETYRARFTRLPSSVSDNRAPRPGSLNGHTSIQIAQPAVSEK